MRWIKYPSLYTTRESVRKRMRVSIGGRKKPHLSHLIHPAAKTSIWEGIKYPRIFSVLDANNGLASGLPFRGGETGLNIGRYADGP
jgi:hypothetical protein